MSNLSENVASGLLSVSNRSFQFSIDGSLRSKLGGSSSGDVVAGGVAVAAGGGGGVGCWPGSGGGGRAGGLVEAALYWRDAVGKELSVGRDGDEGVEMSGGWGMFNSGTFD